MKTNHDEHLAWYRNTILPSILARSQSYTIYKVDDPSTHTAVSNNYNNTRDSAPPVSSSTYSTNVPESTMAATTTPAVRKRPLAEITDIPTSSPTPNVVDLSTSRTNGQRPSLSCKRSRNEMPLPPSSPSTLSTTFNTNNRNMPPQINTADGLSDLGYDDDFDLDDALLDDVIHFEGNRDVVMKEASSSSSTNIIPTSRPDNRPSPQLSTSNQHLSSISSSSIASATTSFTSPPPLPRQHQEDSRRPMPRSFTNEVVVTQPNSYLPPPPPPCRPSPPLPTKNLQQQLADLQQKQSEVANQVFRTSDPNELASFMEEGRALVAKIAELEHQIKNQEPIIIDLILGDDTKDGMDLDDNLDKNCTALVPSGGRIGGGGGSTVASPYFQPSTTTTTPEPGRCHSPTTTSQPFIVAAPSHEPNYPWSADVRHTLHQVFNLAEFRSNQLEAINTTMRGEDVFVLMPTGGGKSLCYQLPATLQQGYYGSTKCPSGVTIVVSPLLSLMVDQVDQLKRRGIQAERLDGTITADHRRQVFQSMHGGGYQQQQQLQLVYVTPEMITKSGAFQDALDRLSANDRLARFVIDEAHCVSQWGHDFRPDYKLLGNLKSKYPAVPLMALTATANPRVQQDVLLNLGITGCKVFKQSFNRPNLKYEVVQRNAKDKVEDIYKFIMGQFRNKCGIIYCSSRDKTEWLAEELQKRGLQVGFYHAGLSNEQRSDTQQKWQRNIYQVIVATVAFGMGIDKPDVRFVVHLVLPLSVEGYYQETGRAGRDGQPATCRLYYSFGDTRGLENMIKSSTDTTWQIKKSQLDNLHAMMNYCRNPVDCRRKLVLAYFGENFDPAQCSSPATCDNCLNTRGKQVYERDMTMEAKLLLQLYQQLQVMPSNYNNQGFGNSNNNNNRNDITLAQLIGAFRGSKSQLNRNRGYTEAENFGAGKQMNNLNVTRMAEHLCATGYLQQYAKQTSSGYTCNYVEFGSKAHALLSGQGMVRLSEIVDTQQPSSSTRPSTASTNGVRYQPPQPQPQPARRLPAPRQEAPRPPAVPSTTPALQHPFDFSQYSMAQNPIVRPRPTAPPSAPTTLDDPPDIKKLKWECYDKMRKLRDELKRRNKLQQPSTVFTDTELKVMAVNLPDTIKIFMELTGIDDEKYDRYGGGFLKLCKEYAENAAKISRRWNQDSLD